MEPSRYSVATQAERVFYSNNILYAQSKTKPESVWKVPTVEEVHRGLSGSNQKK